MSRVHLDEETYALLEELYKIRKRLERIAVAVEKLAGIETKDEDDES